MTILTGYEAWSEESSPSGLFEREDTTFKSKRFAADPDLQAVKANTLLLALSGTKRALPVRSSGPGVHLVQRTLIDLGFGLPKFGADGTFGAETAGAVRAFQVSRGLSPDSMVGPATLGALDSAIAQRESTITPPAPPSPTPPVTALHPSATYWKDVLRIGLANNFVEPLIDGPSTFATMKRVIESAKTRDHFIYLLAWWCDPWVNLVGPGSSLLDLFAVAGGAGVQIRGLMWVGSRLAGPNQVKLHAAAVSALNKLPNCHFQVDDGGLTKSHHQKLLVVRGEQGLVAMTGGVDMNADRLHTLPPPTNAYRADRPSDIGWVGPSGGSGGGSGSGPAGAGEPLHDVHAVITGPNALPLQRAFIRRWWARSESRAIDDSDPLRGTFDDPVPRATGPHFVRIGETFNGRLREPGKFPIDSRKVDAQDIWLRSILAARKFIYIEEQYLSHPCAAKAINRVLPRLDHVIILIPPSEITDFPGRWEARAFFLGIASAGPHGHKVRVYTRAVDPAGECRRSGRHVYVHSKIGMIDDELAIIGSANCNHRGWETDSELSFAVFDQLEGPTTLAKDLRKRLWAEHLGVSASLVDDPVRAKGLWDTTPTRNVCRYDPRAGKDPWTDEAKKLVGDPTDSQPGDPCNTLL